MHLDAKSHARPVPSPASAGADRLRRASLAVLVLLVAEYGLGMYVNLYVSVPSADHSGGVGGAIANGPLTLSLHGAIGLLLGLGALGVLVQAVLARRPGIIVASAAGLVGVGLAAAAGASFASSGHAADSMAMSVLTGVGMLCYAVNLYLLPGRSPGQ